MQYIQFTFGENAEGIFLCAEQIAFAQIFADACAKSFTAFGAAANGLQQDFRIAVFE